MSQRVLVPFDESDPASEAFEEALREYPDDEIVLLHAIDPGTSGHGLEGAAAGDLSGRRREEIEERLADAERRAEQDGAEITTVIERGPPGSTIVEYARENDVDRIVMGSHDRSRISKILLGSVAEDVVKESPVTVTVVR